MRILFLTDNFPPETNAPASRTYEHCKRWAQNGCEVTVVTTVPNFPAGKIFEGYRNRLWSREKLDNVDVIRVWTYVTANEGFIGRSLDYASFMVSAILAAPFLPRADIIVSTSPQFFTPCAAYVISRILRRPWIFELRDLWPDSIVAVGAMQENAIVRALRKLEYFLYRKASRIVSVTHSFARVLVGNGIDAAKISVIPNGADLSLYQPGPKPRELVERLGLGGKFVAAYVGTIGMAHGLGTLLDAAARLQARKDIVLLVVGEGAERRAIAGQAQARGLDNVRFLGPVSKREVCDYWLLCDVALVLLRDTALFRHVIPSKMFEAMGSARPIVLAVEGESETILRDSGAGIAVPPENGEALAAAVAALADDEPKRRAMGSAGRAYVSEKYNRDILAQQMLGVLQETSGP